MKSLKPKRTKTITFFALVVNIPNNEIRHNLRPVIFFKDSLVNLTYMNMACKHYFADFQWRLLKYLLRRNGWPQCKEFHRSQKKLSSLFVLFYRFSWSNYHLNYKIGEQSANCLANSLLNCYQQDVAWSQEQSIRNVVAE